MNSVEDKFDTRRNAQLFKDSKKIFLDRVLAEVELGGDLAIAETFGDERDHLLLARGQQATPLVLSTRSEGTSEMRSIT